MITSQQPSSEALPAKQRRELTPTSGTRPDEPRHRRERRGVERAVHVLGPTLPGAGGPGAAVALAARAGAPAAALGEEHDRQPPPLGQLQHAVGLRVVDRALGAGEHGVVVGHARRSGRRASANSVPLIAADAGDHAVGRELADHLLTGQPGARRQHELAVLDERARVAEVVDVLARRALAGAAALGDGVGPRLVERDRVPLEDLGQVGADVVEVDLVVAAARASATSASSTSTSGWPSNTVSPRLDVELARRRPLAGALITCSIFIASMTSSGSAGDDLVARRRPGG